MADLLQEAIDWLKNPQRTQQVQGIGTSIENTINSLTAAREKDNSLWQQAFGNPQQPLQVTDPSAFRELTQRTFEGPMGLAPAGMMVGKLASNMLPVVQQAKILASQGIPDYKIMEMTGLEKVPVKGGYEWGKNIPDTGATINPDVIKNMTTNKQVRLEDLLNHPELYKAYPELKDLKVEDMSWFWRNLNTEGAYRPTDNTIELKKYWNFDEKSLRDRTSVLLHEIQHAIQNKESWPGGTNVGMFNKESSKNIQRKLTSVEDDIAKQTAALSQNNVSRHTIGNMLDYLEGNTSYLGKNESALIEAIKENKDVAELVKRFQSFDGIRSKLKAREEKAFKQYKATAGEAQARAIQKQFETGKTVTPLTKAYTDFEGSLIYTDPFKPTVK